MAVKYFNITAVFFYIIGVLNTENVILPRNKGILAEKNKTFFFRLLRNSLCGIWFRIRSWMHPVSIGLSNIPCMLPLQILTTSKTKNGTYLLSVTVLFGVDDSDRVQSSLTFILHIYTQVQSGQTVAMYEIHYWRFLWTITNIRYKNYIARNFLNRLI